MSVLRSVLVHRPYFEYFRLASREQNILHITSVSLCMEQSAVQYNESRRRKTRENSTRAPGIWKSFIEKVELEKGEGEGHWRIPSIWRKLEYDKETLRILTYCLEQVVYTE